MYWGLNGKARDEQNRRAKDGVNRTAEVSMQGMRGSCLLAVALVASATRQPLRRSVLMIAVDGEHAGRWSLRVIAAPDRLEATAQCIPGGWRIHAHTKLPEARQSDCNLPACLRPGELVAISGLLEGSADGGSGGAMYAFKDLHPCLSPTRYIEELDNRTRPVLEA